MNIYFTHETTDKFVSMQDITIENACEALDLFLYIKDKRMIKSTFISVNYLEVLKSQSFLAASIDILEYILKMDNIIDDNEINEFDIFKLCNVWSIMSCENDKSAATDSLKRQKLGNCLNLIRFPIMTIDEFEKCQELAPNLLTDDEKSSIILNINEKIRNKFGYSDQPRKRNLPAIQDFTCNDKICMADYIFEKDSFMQTKEIDLIHKYSLSLTPSQMMLFTGISMKHTLNDVRIRLIILENGNIIETAITNLSENVADIKPVIFLPNKQYDFYYTYLNEWPKNFIKVQLFYKNTCANVYSEKHSKITIHRSNSHISELHFKLLPYSKNVV